MGCQIGRFVLVGHGMGAVDAWDIRGIEPSTTWRLFYGKDGWQPQNPHGYRVVRVPVGSLLITRSQVRVLQGPPCSMAPGPRLRCASAPDEMASSGFEAAFRR